MSWKTTGLWQRAFEAQQTEVANIASNQLLSNYLTFRERAGSLTSRIAAALPALTIHDLSHLDALWETADLIAGDDYPLNPAEAFVFGGSVLLHDAALCFEAYSGGQRGLRAHVEWTDAFAAIEARKPLRSLEEKQNEADFSAMRLLHAKRASDLATYYWTDPDGERFYLIESSELRKHYGTLIGTIASSHHWPIEDVVSKLPKQLNALGNMPREWRVDPVKIACLLRCADAAHFDSRRAPDFLRALGNRQGVSADHWSAQNWLERADSDSADPDGRSLIFTSGKTFSEVDAQAWWVAYEALQVVDRELRTSAELLEKRIQSKISPPFRIQRVTGANSPEAASNSITTSGWTPKNVEIRVGNLERLIDQLGGTRLYGESQLSIVTLRELLQNSRDAVVARRLLDPSYGGRIRVSVRQDGDVYLLEVEDDGVGMSYRTITGPLLDFGSSFWSSDLVQDEYPGLLSRGYKSVGRFGIGFYSIFMIAQSASIASRRFDCGLDDVTHLKFPNGLSLRPILGNGAPKGFSYQISTKVSLTLKPDIGNPSEVLIHPGRKGYEDETRVPLAQCLSIICAGLDVEVEFCDKGGNLKVVHRPHSLCDTDDQRERWLLDLNGIPEKSKAPDALREHASRLRYLTQDSRIFGLAALSIVGRPQGTVLYIISTVDGLSPTISADRAGYISGYIDYNPASAKRDPSNEPIAGFAAVTQWVNEQIRLLPSWDSDPLAWCFATNHISDLGCDPTQVFTVVVEYDGQKMPFSLDRLLELIINYGLAIYRSSQIAHVETHHSEGQYLNFPTLFPVDNSAFLSLERDEVGMTKENSIISCIKRRALKVGVEIEENLSLKAARSYFGTMDVITLTGRRAL